MGKKFDSLCNKESSYTDIEKYLLSLNFYWSTMAPRFLNGTDYDRLTHDKKCLRKDVIIKKNYTLRLFINDTDIYYEVETPWRSYDMSELFNAKEYKTVDDIDDLLDEILDTITKY